MWDTERTGPRERIWRVCAPLEVALSTSTILDDFFCSFRLVTNHTVLFADTPMIERLQTRWTKFAISSVVSFNGTYLSTKQTPLTALFAGTPDLEVVMTGIFDI